MKPVMREPDTKTDRNERMTVPDNQRESRAPASSPFLRQPCGQEQKENWLYDQARYKNHPEYRRLLIDAQNAGEPALRRINRADHSKSVQKRAESENHGQRRQIFAAREVTYP